MILIALRSLFFVTVIIGYSSGIWRLINEYFRTEFKSFLDEEVKRNKYVMVDPINVPGSEGGLVANGEAASGENEVKQPGSITANGLLDEMIVNFGRMFTTRNEREISTGKTETHGTYLKTSSATKDEAFSKVPPDTKSDRARLQTITDPGGGEYKQDDALEVKDQPKLVKEILIESDELPRSSSETINVDVDDEEKWINYWKNREHKQVNGGDEIEYCRGSLKTKPLIDDSCGSIRAP